MTRRQSGAEPTPLQARIIQYTDRLYRVSLPVPVSGFDDFISAWVHIGDPVCIIDVGPAISSAALLSALKQLGVNRLDYILLTHIHIDHAGGIAAIAGAYPDTPVICHANAIEHLVNPQRLWQGSLKTLGQLARTYQPIEAVPPHRLCSADQMRDERINAVPTPGHAVHHYSYLIDDYLFAGEAAGNCLPQADGRYYLRPATPPRFFLETHLQSLDRLIELKPDKICYGHVGMHTQGLRLLETHRGQLLLWQELIQPYLSTYLEDPTASQEACRDHLLKNDPLLAEFESLSTEVQERERGFMINSIKGYLGYLSQK